MLVFFAHTYLVEKGTACRNSGFLVQGQTWGTFSYEFGRAACRMPCVTRACAVRTLMLPPPQKKKGRRFKLSGCNFVFEDASSSPVKRFFFLFLFVCPFFFPFFPYVFLIVCVFAQTRNDTCIICITMELHGSPQLCLPCAGTGLEYWYIIIQLGCVCNAFVMRACAVCNAWCFLFNKNIPRPSRRHDARVSRRPSANGVSSLRGAHSGRTMSD